MAATDVDQPSFDAARQQKEQRYIELLEKRIIQLEAALGAIDTKKEKEGDGKKNEKGKSGSDVEAPDDPKTDNKSEDEDADDTETDDTKTKDKNTDKTNVDSNGKPTGRYVNALREWDKKTAAYKDQIVGESAFKKDPPKNVAYTFRRVVYNTDRGQKEAHSEIEIEDNNLILLLKSKIDEKYPGVNFDGDKVYMAAPFPAIVHNWDRLQQRAKQDPESQASKDLAHLLQRVETAPELEDYFKTREANVTGKVTTFETLWTVFAPKTLVVVKPFLNTPQLLLVSSSPIPYSGVPISQLQRLYLTAWCWDWNGKEMVKVFYWLKFKRFRGTKEISELDFYPLSYHAAEKELRETARKRSLQFLRATKFCKPGASQMLKYDGNAYVARRKIVAGADEDDDDDDGNALRKDDDTSTNAKMIPITGEIICDAEAYLQYASNTRSHLLGEMEHAYTEEPSTEIDAIFERITPAEAEAMGEENDNILIIPPRLLGYATREKLWGQFAVDKTNPAPGKQKQKFQENLQLDTKYKDLIEALVDSHEEARSAQVEDIVTDKGKGLVLLLHGPPGVGKTLTAETIAQATGKPLFVVSVAEIGLDASRAERNLEKMFNLATKWEAILLVDEADVFLETRGSTSSADRNALVSVLLRVLEYYKGIIILTTNRIKSIDVAVISRIHLAIRYLDLEPHQMRAIFKYFLDKVDDKIGQKNRDNINYFIDTTGHHYGLNGRQIRNVVSAALAAAQHAFEKGTGDGRLTDKYLRDVCEMTRDFQEQLKDNTMAQRYNNEAMRGYGR